MRLAACAFEGFGVATCSLHIHPVLSAAAAKIGDYSGVGVVKYISYDVLKTINTGADPRPRPHTCPVRLPCVAVAAVAPT